jgi:hypothetical protein
MFKKTIRLLRANPIIFIAGALFVLLTAAISIPMVSEARDILQINSDMLDTLSNFDFDDGEGIAESTEDIMTSAMDIRMSTWKMYAYLLLLGLLTIGFIAGYGNMIAAAMNEGRAGWKTFFHGFKKFFGKVFLSSLLLMGIAIALSIVLSSITVPLIIAQTIKGSLNMESLMKGQKAIQLITYSIAVFTYPLIMLWMPSIFTNRKDGVVNCFKHGIRAGKKKYKQLVALAVIMIIPSFLMTLLTDNVYKMIETNSIFLIYPFAAVIVPIVTTYLFVMYHDFKAESALKEPVH